LSNPVGHNIRPVAGLRANGYRKSGKLDRFRRGAVRKRGSAMERTFRCYIEGKGADWEAVCLDLDVAVQGESFHDVVDRLVEAVKLHVQYVLSLPAAEQSRFWARSAPFALRVRFLWYAFKSTIRHNGAGDKERAELLLPCPA